MIVNVHRQIPTGDRRRDERGSVALEVVIVVPALMMLLALLIAGGRVWMARSELTDIANDAARAASLAGNAGQARSYANKVVDRSNPTAPCQGVAVHIDPSDFARPVGTAASVRTRLTCRVQLSDLGLPGAPGSITVEGRGTSALDTYRERE